MSDLPLVFVTDEMASVIARSSEPRALMSDLLRIGRIGGIRTRLDPCRPHRQYPTLDALEIAADLQ